MAPPDETSPSSITTKSQTLLTIRVADFHPSSITSASSKTSVVS
jgi:hypothetical protein